MTLRIAQEARLDGKDWWSWSVWLEGTVSDLDGIRSVEWVLHPTFPNPIREIKDRKSGFRLKTSGWGGFRIKARVHLNQGKPLQLTHDLTLVNPGEQPKRRAVARPTSAKKATKRARSLAPPSRPRIFLSYSSSDLGAAEATKKILEQHSISWTDASASAEMGGTLRASIATAVAASDAVLTLGTHGASSWSDWEVATARTYGIPVISLDLSSKSGAERDRQTDNEIRARVERAIESHLRSGGEKR